MKLILQGSKNIEVLSKNDLGRLIPKTLKGKVINYGQGEGQIEIENTVWGFYVNKNEEYQLVYEKGLESLGTINNYVNEITNHISKEYGVNIELFVEGSFANDSENKIT